MIYGHEDPRKRGDKKIAVLLVLEIATTCSGGLGSEPGDTKRQIHGARA